MKPKPKKNKRCKHKWIESESHSNFSMICLFCQKCCKLKSIHLFDENGNYVKGMKK